MSHPEENGTKYLIGQVVSSISTTNELIQSLAKELQTNAVTLATMKAGIGNLDQVVHSLSKIIKEGSDGHDPLLSRIAVLENISETLECSVKELELNITGLSAKLGQVGNKIDGIDKELHAKALLQEEAEKGKSEEKKDKFQVFIAILTSVAALATAILSGLLTYFLSK